MKGEHAAKSKGKLDVFVVMGFANIFTMVEVALLLVSHPNPNVFYICPIILRVIAMIVSCTLEVDSLRPICCTQRAKYHIFMYYLSTLHVVLWNRCI